MRALSNTVFVVQMDVWARQKRTKIVAMKQVSWAQNIPKMLAAGPYSGPGWGSCRPAYSSPAGGAL